MGEPVAVTFLGGLGEIGRNCAVIETGGRRVMLDCGRMFAGAAHPGVESILPDFDGLLAGGGIEACVATHAHEDHIGGLPYLLRHLSFPVYGSPFTLGLVRHKLAEEGLLHRADLREVRDHQHFRAGPFDCEALPVTHSVPGGLITAFTTPQGVILHSSDFKLDLTPVDGRRTALSRIGSIADDPGVRLLLADSTNADTPGSSRSETEVGASLRELIAGQHGRRVVVGAFASHIHRIQQLMDAGIDAGRVVATLGRSMKRNVALARELGLLRVHDGALLDIEELDGLPPEQVLIVCTGSQGEPLAALSQMADGRSKWVDIGDDDTVIFSSHPIPGNEAEVAAVRSKLARRGARVLHSGHLEVHTSGHGGQQELRVLHSVASPEWFIPVHGEHEHMVAHARLARQMGMADERVLLCADGDRIEMTDAGLARTGSVGGGHLYVDGTVGNLANRVLSDRRKLGADGVVAVVVRVDLRRGRIVAGPDVMSRGWVEQPEEYEGAVAAAVEKELRSAVESGCDLKSLEDLVLRTAKRATRHRTRRRPMVLPLVHQA